MTSTDVRLGGLFSGGASTLQAIFKECNATGRLWQMRPGCAIASTSEAGGIPAIRRLVGDENVAVIERRNFASREAFGEAIIAFCRARGVDWLGQYGWLPWTPKNVIEAFAGRMINQHPGPVRPGRPGFGGRYMHGIHVHAARLLFVRKTNRDWWTEATAQRVHPEYDEGEVLRVGRVTIQPDDTPETLQRRVLPVEHETQIRTLQDVMLDRVRPARDLPELIRPGEEALLDACKREAIAAYAKR